MNAPAAIIPPAIADNDIDAALAAAWDMVGDALEEGIVVFSKDGCPFCRRTDALLERLGAEHITLKLETQAERDRLYDGLELEGSARTVPQIFVKGAYVGGYHDLVQHVAAGGLD